MAWPSLRRAIPAAAAAAMVMIAGSKSQPAAGALAPSQLTIYHYWDWGWGELTYGQSYATTLVVNNLCDSDQPVTMSVTDPFRTVETERDGKKVKLRVWLNEPVINGKAQNGTIPEDQKSPVSARAMLSIPKAGCNAVPFGGDGSATPTECSTVVPPGATTFDVTIATPPPPDPKSIPRGTDPLTVYQDIAGKLVIRTKGFPPVCLPSQEEYYPGGHVHLPPAALEGGPRCRDWWDREQKPTGLTKDCTKEIRDLALHYVRVTLKPIVAKNPDAWTWLPTEEQILGMAVEPLIAMKVRARESMRKTPRR